MTLTEPDKISTHPSVKGFSPEVRAEVEAQLAASRDAAEAMTGGDVGVDFSFYGMILLTVVFAIFSGMSLWPVGAHYYLEAHGKPATATVSDFERITSVHNIRGYIRGWVSGPRYIYFPIVEYADASGRKQSAVVYGHHELERGDKIDIHYNASDPADVTADSNEDLWLNICSGIVLGCVSIGLGAFLVFKIVS